MTHPPGALDGIRVLEVGTLIAGPFAGKLLGDHGADVIKVETPDRPDPLRDWGQAEVDGFRFMWTLHSRNKRCITLDLRLAAGRDVFLRLAATADVVLENLRPGTLEKWRLGWDELHAVNPRLVLARVSGYGQTGPAATRAGYASVAEGVSGLRHLNGYPGQAPPRTALSLGDAFGGMFAAQGILAALVARARTGEGQVVDVALTEACLALLESTVPDYDRAGHVREPSGTRLDGVAPSNLYAARDGAWVIVAANQDTVFRRLCGAMGRPELADDPRFADHESRGKHQDEIDAIVSAWAGGLPATRIVEILDAAGVVAGPVNTVAEVVRDPQFLARGIFVDHQDDEGVGGAVKGVGVVPRLSATPGGVRWAGPRRLGAHNEEIYGGELGLGAAEFAELRSSGVI